MSKNSQKECREEWLLKRREKFCLKQKLEQKIKKGIETAKKAVSTDYNFISLRNL